jgi:hypothetical protein
VGDVFSKLFSNMKAYWSMRKGYSVEGEPRGVMKLMRRVLLPMRRSRVGQVVGMVEGEGGVYASLSMPEDVKMVPSSEGVALSELTMRTVTTSFVFLSIHVLISDNQLSKVPASNSVQLL